MVNFSFNGQKSDDFCLRVKNEITLKSSTRDFTFDEIPGFDGDVIISNNRLKAFDIVFPCRLNIQSKNRFKTLFEAKNAILSWLMADDKVHELRFTGDSGYVYRALYVGGDDISRITSWEGDIDVVFRVYPWKFAESGFTPITVQSNGFGIHNPMHFASKPIFKIIGSGDVTVSFTNNGTTQTLEFEDLTSSEEITVNCETGEVYAGDGSSESLNRAFRVQTYPLPTLQKGTTSISITGTHTSFKVTPMWRTLA